MSTAHCSRRSLLSFPTRRSSDLRRPPVLTLGGQAVIDLDLRCARVRFGAGTDTELNQRVRFLGAGDRKSTRLNSSHLVISYAVFCLKKTNKYIHNKRKKKQILRS